MSTWLEEGGYASDFTAPPEEPDPLAAQGQYILPLVGWLKNLAQAVRPAEEAPAEDDSDPLGDLASWLKRLALSLEPAAQKPAPEGTKPPSPEKKARAAPGKEGAAADAAQQVARRKGARKTRKQLTDKQKLARRRMARLALVLVVASIVSPLLATSTPARAYAVASGSMEPQIQKGALVFVGPGTAEVGDVIAFKAPDGQMTIHRVKGIQHLNGKTYYSTRGDANAAPDSFAIPASQVQGVVVKHVPYVGYLWLMPLMLQAGLFIGFIAVYMIIVLWDAGFNVFPARTTAAAIGMVMLLALVPAGSASVRSPTWPDSTQNVNINSPSNIPITAGDMASSSIAADQNSATATMGPPVLWKEHVLWGCDPAVNPPGGCTMPIPNGGYVSWEGSLFNLDTNQYDGSPMYFFEAVLSSASPLDTVCAQLVTSAAVPVPNSEVCTTSTTPTRVRSNSIAIMAGSVEYKFQTKGSGASDPTGTFYTAKILVRQAYPTKTVTTVLVSGGDMTTDDSYAYTDRAVRWNFAGNTAEYSPSIDNVADGNGQVFMEVVGKEVGGGEASVRLDEIGGGATFQCNFNSAITIRTRCTNNMNGEEGSDWQPQFRHANSGNLFTLYAVRMIMIQSVAFTKTVRYVDLGQTNQTDATSFIPTEGYPAQYYMGEEWGGVTAFFESSIDSLGGTTEVRLRDETAGSIVAGSTLSDSGTITRVRSAAVALNKANATYSAEFRITAAGNTAQLFNAWIIMIQNIGKTYDYVLRTTNNVGTCTWTFTLKYVSGAADRLNTTITLRGSTTVDQIILTQTTVTQSEGTAVSVAPGATLDHLVFTNPYKAGGAPTTILADQKGHCGTGIHTVQRITYVYN